MSILLNRVLGYLIARHDLTKDHKGIEIEKFIIHKSWNMYKAGLKKSCGEVNTGYRQRIQKDLKHMSLLESTGRVLWNSKAKARFDNSNKQYGLGKFYGSLIKEHIRGRPWEVGENAYCKVLWGTHIKD